MVERSVKYRYKLRQTNNRLDKQRSPKCKRTTLQTIYTYAGGECFKFLSSCLVLSFFLWMQDSASYTLSCFRFFPGTQELGEIYSLAVDTGMNCEYSPLIGHWSILITWPNTDLWLVHADHLITGHTLNTSAFKVWRTEDFEEVKIIKVSVFWIFLSF